jgi:phosphoserine phosphatase
VLAQLVFVRYGAGTSRVGQTADSAMALLKGLPVGDDARDRPGVDGLGVQAHVYRDALDLVARHRERGEKSFVVSAALQEIVDALVAELGLDGGDGSTAEVENGVYTGRLVRRLDGRAKAEALAELAATDASISRSRRLTPTRRRRAVPGGGRLPGGRESRPQLRGIAAERGWRVLRFSDKAFPG